MGDKTDVSNIVEDIYKVLDQENDHTVSEENLKSFGDTLVNLMRERFRSREQGETLRFSSLGKKDRQLWYQEHQPDKAEKLPPKVVLKFIYGDLIEALLVFLCKEAGYAVEDEQAEVEVDGIKGHIDFRIGDTVVDVKSASSYSFNKFVSGAFLTSDPFGYVKQISGYRYALGTERAGFLVADKVHGDVAWIEVSGETLTANEPSNRIQHLREVLSNSVEPEKCYEDKPEGVSGNRVLDIGCSYCPYKFHCWRDSNGGKGLQVYAYSSGPKFFSKVVREPKVAKEDW